MAPAANACCIWPSPRNTETSASMPSDAKMPLARAEIGASEGESGADRFPDAQFVSGERWRCRQRERRGCGDGDRGAPGNRPLVSSAVLHVLPYWLFLKPCPQHRQPSHVRWPLM